MATRRKMENDIAEVLCCSAKRCLALKDLQFYLKPDEDTLEDGLAGLLRNKILKRKGGMYCYIKPIEIRPVSLHENRLLVATHLSKAKEARTTGEIATACGLNSNQVYQICKRFEEKGFFEKGEPKLSTRRQFYAVIIRQIMHRRNYDLISDLNTELRKIIRKSKLKDPALLVKVHAYFRTKIEQYPRYEKVLKSAMKRFIEAIKRARTIDQVLEHLELRPFYPELRTWQSAVRSRT